MHRLTPYRILPFSLFITALLPMCTIAAFAQQPNTLPRVDPNYVPRPPVPVDFPRAVLAPGVGPNVRCNSRVTCPDGRGVLQSETTLAINGAAVICGYNDFRGFFCPERGYQVAGWAYSLNGGSIFIDGGRLPGAASLAGDPWLASGPQGRIYYSSLWNGVQGIAVLRGMATASGIQWSAPTVLTTGGPFDKEAMAVDQNTGAVYLVYSRLSDPFGIWLFRSSNEAASFEGPFPVETGGGALGAFPAIGPAGEVYVTWKAFDQIVFARSFDEGMTFDFSQAVGDVCDFLVEGASRTPAFPQMAVDTTLGPNRGEIYIVWHTSCLRDSGDVVLVCSNDGGDTWSEPVLVNDDSPSAVHFFPTISVDALGRVNVFFYDRRENPGTAITNVYFAQSATGGSSFGRNLRMTEVASLWLPSEGIPNYGDYISSVSVGTTACVAYTDGRNGDPDAYFTCISPEQTLRPQ